MKVELTKNGYLFICPETTAECLALKYIFNTGDADAHAEKIVVNFEMLDDGTSIE